MQECVLERRAEESRNGRRTSAAAGARAATSRRRRAPVENCGRSGQRRGPLLKTGPALERGHREGAGMKGSDQKEEAGQAG